MPLPKAVMEAAARAEELQKKLLEQQQQPAQPEQTQQTTENGEQPAPAPTEEAPKPEANSENSETWKKKFDVLTGKYNAEVPRMAAQLRDATATIRTLQAEVTALKARPAAAPESLLKPEEIQEFGEPLIDVTRRVAQEVTRQTASEVEALKKKVESYETNKVRDTEVRFYEDLAEACPDWVVINDDSNFHAFLQSVDPFSGRTLQDLIEDAEAARDAKRVSSFFLRFKQGVAEQETAAKSKLEEQIAPDEGSPSNAPPAKRVWSRREIADFYSQWRRGVIPSEKAVVVEAEIQKATLEGRVR